MLQVTRVADPALSIEAAAVLKEFASSAGGCRSAQHALAREIVRLRERQAALERSRRLAVAGLAVALAGAAVAAGLALYRILSA
jgi:hypothetical protein